MPGMPQRTNNRKPFWQRVVGQVLAGGLLRKYVRPDGTSSSGAWWRSLDARRDIRFAVRSLCKSPWYAASVVIAIAFSMVLATTVFAVYFWIQYRARQRELDSPLASHRSGHSHIGQVVVLEQGLQNGQGRIRLGNRDWPVRGPNLPAGAKARVTGVDGTILLVDRVAA